MGQDQVSGGVSVNKLLFKMFDHVIFVKKMTTIYHVIIT